MIYLYLIFNFWGISRDVEGPVSPLFKLLDKPENNLANLKKKPSIILLIINVNTNK